MDDRRREVQQLAKLGPRAIYGKGLFELAADNKKIIALSADLGKSSGLDRFKASYPDRFFNVGIAEQTLVGVASGIANEGFSVFASSFAPFLAFRASEQVRMNMGYMKQPVTLVGLGSGLSMGFLGNSHYGLEDLAIMRTIPGITIVSPADPVQLKNFLKIACDYRKPIYIRLTGAPNSPTVYESDDKFQFGVSNKLIVGSDIAIISTGSILAYVIQAAEKLQKIGITPTVIDFHTIKPLDTGTLKDLATEYSHVITVEEHSKIGGLGGAIAEFYSDFDVRPKHLIIGLEDNYGSTADYFFLLEKYGLTGEGIFSSVIKFLKKSYF